MSRKAAPRLADRVEDLEETVRLLNDQVNKDACSLRLLKEQIDEHGRILSALCAEGRYTEAHFAEPALILPKVRTRELPK